MVVSYYLHFACDKVRTSAVGKTGPWLLRADVYAPDVNTFQKKILLKVFQKVFSQKKLKKNKQKSISNNSLFFKKTVFGGLFFGFQKH